DEVRERAARAQSAGILAKPFAADDLMRHLDNLLMQTPPPPPPAATRETAPVAPPPTTTPNIATPVAEGAGAILAQFVSMDGVQCVWREGVQWAVRADREGCVVESTANAGVDAEVAAALSACLAESSDGLGRELGRGALQGAILEFEKGMVVIYGVANVGLLAV